MFGSEFAQPWSLEDLAHVIQVALTPVFLLSAIAALLNVFSARLARVADRVDQLGAAIEGASPDEAARSAAKLAYLRRRSIVLDAAVVLGGMAGAATCTAALALFVGALRNKAAATILFALFGLALLLTVGALALFVAEILLSGRGVRADVADSRRSASRR